MQIKDVRSTKNNLRDMFRNKRLGFTPQQKAEYDEMIFQKLCGLYQYKNASVVLCYVSKIIEVDTLKFITQALSDGKRVAVPRCIDGTRKMDFYFINSLDDLEKGSFGVYEPKTDICTKLTDLKNGLCVVPGMAFDTSGYRLGYGKGYYDRFLSQFGGRTVGICYSCCIKWNLPRGKFDKPVDILLTEKYIRRTDKNNSAT